MTPTRKPPVPTSATARLGAAVVLTTEEFRYMVPTAQRSTVLIGFGRNACELKGQNEWAEAGALYREALRIDRTNPTPPLRHDGILMLWCDVMRHTARCRAPVRHLCHVPLRHDFLLPVRPGAVSLFGSTLCRHRSLSRPCMRRYAGGTAKFLPAVLGLFTVLSAIGLKEDATPCRPARPAPSVWCVCGVCVCMCGGGGWDKAM